MIQWQARHTKTKTPLPLSYLFAFLLAMGSFPAACFLLSFLTHIQRSPTVLPLSSLFLIQHVGAHGVEWQQLLSSLLKRCHRNVHLEAVKEGLFHAKWECAWSEERLGGLCWCSLTPSSSSFFFSPLPLHVHKHSHTLASTFTEVHSHLLPSLCAIGDSLQRALRQGVEAGGKWRNRDGEGRWRGGGCWYMWCKKKEKIDREVDWRSVFLTWCRAAYLSVESRGTLSERGKDTQKCYMGRETEKEKTKKQWLRRKVGERRE